MKRRIVSRLFIGMIAAALPVAAGHPQRAVADEPKPSTLPAEELISLNFPENLELKVLIEYVSQRLGINILYDEQTVSQRLTIQSPTKIPKSSLLGLLESALKMKGLVLINAEQPGWKRIVSATALITTVGPTTRVADATTRPSTGAAVTQVLTIRFADLQKVDQTIKPFLSQPGGNSIALADQRLLIITDYASNLPHILELIKLIDQPQREPAVQFVAVKNVDAAQLATQVQQILTSKYKSRSGTTAEMVDIAPDARTNQIVAIGPPEQVEEAVRIIGSLDVALEMTTKIYQFKVASAERVDRLTKELIGPLDAKRLYQSAIDKEANLLVVTTTLSIHEKITSLQADLDKPVAADLSPVRFYKLANATAADVLQTIRAIEGETGMDNVSVDSGPATAPNQDLQSNSGLNVLPTFQGQTQIYPTDRPSQSPDGVSPPSPPNQQVAPRQTLKTKQAIVTADPNTNTLIVVADPTVQRVYEQLIKNLDKRRPQVLIECTLITLDISHGVSLGVELAYHNGDGTKVITFTSFGLSTVDGNTGQLVLKPGAGFNGALISSDIADIVVRALATDTRAKVLSAPRILVNDNATGTLSSVNEAPFTSVNASSTVATTSFAGYATAGTVITVTPHISEGDHLQLEYQIALNSFTGQGSNGVPPPRQTNSVTSEVTVPDGSTIIIGGLNRKSENESVSSVPVLGSIPLLKYLFSSRSKDSSTSTLFVFLRPIILRDDQFEDLKYYSERDARAAGIAGDFPVSGTLSVQ